MASLALTRTDNKRQDIHSRKSERLRHDHACRMVWRTHLNRCVGLRARRSASDPSVTVRTGSASSSSPQVRRSSATVSRVAEGHAAILPAPGHEHLEVCADAWGGRLGYRLLGGNTAMAFRSSVTVA